MQTNSNQHTADVILRSSDAKMFYSWKTLLSISSPVFNDMFTLPQPDDTSDNDNVDECHWHDGLPVIDLAEDSRTLGHILSLCHPPSCTGEQFKVNNVCELRDVLEAAMKYDMENLRCVALKELTNPSFLREYPLRIYVLACQHQCHEAAWLAAKHTLALPTLMREHAPAELEKIHAGKLWSLLCYREACIAATCPLANNHTWIVYTHFSPLFGCEDEDMGWTTVSLPPSRKYRMGRTENMSVHTWWLQYMKKAGYALQRSPHGDSVRDKGLLKDVMSAISSSECKQCKALEVWETFRCFVDSFAEHIERRVAEVEIHP